MPNKYEYSFGCDNLPQKDSIRGYEFDYAEDIR